jgi:hypothetical protein
MKEPQMKQYTLSDIEAYAKANFPSVYAQAPSKEVINDEWLKRKSQGTFFEIGTLRMFVRSPQNGRKEQRPGLLLADARKDDVQFFYCNESFGILRYVDFDAYSSEYSDRSKLKYPFNHLILPGLRGIVDHKPVSAFLKYCLLAVGRQSNGRSRWQTLPPESRLRFWTLYRRQEEGGYVQEHCGSVQC